MFRRGLDYLRPAVDFFFFFEPSNVISLRVMVVGNANEEAYHVAFLVRRYVGTKRLTSVVKSPFAVPANALKKIYNKIRRARKTERKRRRARERYRRRKRKRKN